MQGICAGCQQFLPAGSRRRTCSNRCRNCIWRQARCGGGRRRAVCEWCNAPLLYLPQDALPGARRFCDAVCARRAWLVTRARRELSSVTALEVAIRRLRRGRHPRQLAAAAQLTDLMNELQTRDNESKTVGIGDDVPIHMARSHPSSTTARIDSQQDLRRPALDRAAPAASEATATDAARGRASRRVLFLVTLTCLLCSREVGQAESTVWPAHRGLVLRQPGCAPRLVLDWRGLQCPVCQGAVVAADITTRVSRSEKPIDWTADKPRRGRPPKKLAEARTAPDLVDASPTIAP